VAVFTVVAGLRVSESVRVAAFLSAAEVLGLALVLAAGAPALGAGTFIAFFAYIGFEGMANMAEETEDVGRTLPRAILIALAVSAFLYAAVSLVAVLAVSPAVLADSPAPLVSVLEQRAPWLVDLFVVIAVVATLNGVLIEIVVVSRLAYGMARRGHWWTWLGRVDPRTRTPIHATTTVGALALGLVLAIPFDLLVILTSGLTLGVFAAVNASLWRLKRKEPRPHDVAIVVPTWVPVAGGLACAGLIAVMVARAF
jgi:amino acid transporter